MELALIVPFPMLADRTNDAYHMILAQLLCYEEYGTFYHDVQGFRILDNGVAEGKQVSVETLIGWAQVLKVDEVIAPDVMYDTDASIDLLIDFSRKAQDFGLNVMAVLQAQNWVQFDYILDAALTLNVAAVALPKLLTKHMGPEARLAGANIIREKSDIPIHCLGCSTRIGEVRDLARQGIVRSIDSSAPVVLGLQDQSIKHARYDWEVSHSVIDDFWNQKTNDQVEANIATFKHWCTETPSLY